MGTEMTNDRNHLVSSSPVSKINNTSSLALEMSIVRVIT